MKKFLILFLFTGLTYGQQLSKNEVNQQIGLVWGLVKYHHPDVSRGKYDWNRELLTVLEKSREVRDQKELNKILLELSTGYNTKKTRFKPGRNSAAKGIFRRNEDYNWIQDYDFGPELTRELLKLKDNRRIGDHYASREILNNFLNFENEKPLADFDQSLESHRLLLLYNFWNAIQYWYVNKYLMDEDWREILPELTREFSEATTTEKFEVAKLKMNARLNDSHSYRTSSYLWDSLYNRSPAMNGRIVNDSLVITRVMEPAGTAQTNIQPGDVITYIEGLPVKDYVEKNFAPIFSASNRNYLHNRIQNWYLLSGKTDSLRIRVLSPQSGISEQQRIPLYRSFGSIDSVRHLYTPWKEYWYDLTPEVTYINLDSITSAELKSAFNHGKDKKAIVLDLRNYPRQIRDTDISKYLFPRKKKFVKVLFPESSNPSYGDPDGKAPLRFILDPFKSGKKNRNYYKGRVILLVDRSSMSYAEYLAMVIQAAPNVTTIGEQTAGAPLNIWTYTLADGQTTSFTGLGGFYPDGRGVQREGVALDHVITESALHYDPELYLKEALKIIEEDTEIRLLK
ncbi:S41 family peptidase [Salinimicrobium xinjiangense]|uniref:S41 family peptidase n=1 Tax=Salinimicrobium xinjiangense TaxID=438596 RepID=UPI00146CB7E8|nr:S41 family peptidase [Salinimicrobium xinjiangense]